MTGEEMRQRNRFELWISSEPYAKTIERWPEGAMAWPGQYMDFDVQLAWEAWMEGYCGISHCMDNKPL